MHTKIRQIAGDISRKLRQMKALENLGYSQVLMSELGSLPQSFSLRAPLRHHFFVLLLCGLCSGIITAGGMAGMGVDVGGCADAIAVLVYKQTKSTGLAKESKFSFRNPRQRLCFLAIFFVFSICLASPDLSFLPDGAPSPSSASTSTASSAPSRYSSPLSSLRWPRK